VNGVSIINYLGKGGGRRENGGGSQSFFI